MLCHERVTIASFSICSHVIRIMTLRHFFSLHVLDLLLPLGMLQGHHCRYRIVLRHFEGVLCWLLLHYLGLWRFLLVVGFAWSSCQILFGLTLATKRHCCIVFPFLFLLFALLLLIFFLLVNLAQERRHRVVLDLFLSFLRYSLDRQLVKCLERRATAFNGVLQLRYHEPLAIGGLGKFCARLVLHLLHPILIVWRAVGLLRRSFLLLLL